MRKLLHTSLSIPDLVLISLCSFGAISSSDMGEEIAEGSVLLVWFSQNNSVVLLRVCRRVRIPSATLGIITIP